MKPIAISIMASVVTLFLASPVYDAQIVTEKHPVTDAEKIEDALRAGPAFITKDATLLDWPATPNGEYRLLRKGTSEWSCLPGVPGYPHDEPGCFDRVFMQWVKDSLAGRTPHINTVGISYMYMGAWVPGKGDKSANKEFHVGPHVMIVTPHQDDVQTYNRDGSTGMPYANHLPNRSELFLVVPIRQWNEK